MSNREALVDISPVTLGKNWCITIARYLISLKDLAYVYSYTQLNQQMNNVVVKERRRLAEENF